MSVPDDLSVDIAAQLATATGFVGYGDFIAFPYAGADKAIIVNRTLDRRVETEYSHTYGNDSGKPNLYTVILMTSRFKPGVDYTQAKADRHAALAAIRAYLHTAAGSRLNAGSGPLCAKAGDPLEVKSDPQGPVISYLREPFIGAYITLGVYEAYTTD